MTPNLRITLYLLLIMAARPVIAQVDTEFWFAPPEVTQGHGDAPLYLRISTLDKDALVKVTQPARSGLVLASAMISANTTFTLDLTQYKTGLETILPATVMKTGLKIESSSPVTAYYEIGAAWNADIFPLKGRNALGNRFVIPAQNFYNNSTGYSPLPSSAVDIVATSNNTVVKVRPTRPVMGHVNDTLIVIKLNAGETYSLKKTTSLASDNPAGTVIESSKPVAITLKDDSVINGGCHDLLGDQLVPVEVAGTEYIVLKGFLESQEYLFITAIEDGTELYFNGGATAHATLQAGEVFRYPVSHISTYVVGTKPIYVFHVTGFGCEMGMAILPSINCKGSTQIGFSRTTSEFFGLNILVRKEGIDHFKVNGSSTLIPPGAFTPVAGTDDRWYTAQLSFSTAQLPVGQGSLITNERNSFQIGIINGNASSTCRYGYFSAFSTLFIGDDFTMCEGAQAVLDAGPDKESYLWSTGETTRKIQITAPGEYAVRVLREDCELYDTITVQVKRGELDVGADVEICPADTTHIDGKENFRWQWSDGSTGQFLQTTLPGKYWVSVFDYNGCEASDTVNVFMKEAPAVALGDDIVKCPGTAAEFDIEYPGATYLWSDGTTDFRHSLHAPGDYSAKVFLNGCVAADTVTITNLPGPFQDAIYGSPSVCPFVESVEYRVEEGEDMQFAWTVNGGLIATDDGNAVTIDWEEARSNASVELVVTDSDGCTRALHYSVRINPALIVEIPEGPDTLCLNKAEHVLYTTPMTNGSVYDWRITGGEIESGQGSNEVFVAWSEGVNTLSILETSTTIDTVCTGESVQLEVFVFRDRTKVTLHAVSVDTANPAQVVVDWSYRGDSLHRPIELHKQSDEATGWQSVTTLSPANPRVVDENALTDQAPQYYYIGLTNNCDEPVTSLVHNTIVLYGHADSTDQVINLRWNHYGGWAGGVERYEIWRRLDDAPGLRLLTSVSGSDTQYAAPLATDGFRHRYVVKAVEASGDASSWSNAVDFEFDHPVVIPNVITPNGDGKNEFFSITNIRLYGNAVLIITDRWGKTVLQARGYQNDWNGEGLSAGVYYYSLYVDRNRRYKGLISILR